MDPRVVEFHAPRKHNIIRRFSETGSMPTPRKPIQRDQAPGRRMSMRRTSQAVLQVSNTLLSHYLVNDKISNQR